VQLTLRHWESHVAIAWHLQFLSQFLIKVGKFCRKLKFDSCLSSFTSINAKWIKDLEGNIGKSRENIDFFSRTQVAQQLREWMDKQNCMKLKSFCPTKEMVSKLKIPHTEWEKIFASYTSDKELITRIYRELKRTKLSPNQ
jgi:hypothetical protein